MGLRLSVFISVVFCVAVVMRSAWNVHQPVAFSLAGIIVVASACLLFVCSLRCHPRKPGKAFATIAPDTLVKRGPYGVVRHPIYLSYIMAWLGMVLLTGSTLVAILTAWMTVLYTIAARMEEDVIRQSANATRYLSYTRDVGMFLPKLRVRPQEHRPMMIRDSQPEGLVKEPPRLVSSRPASPRSSRSPAPAANASPSGAAVRAGSPLLRAG